MITLDVPPKLILPDHYQANRPAIIRPGVDLAKFFPVEIDRKTRRAIVSKLAKLGLIDDRAKAVRLVEAAIPFGMFKAAAPDVALSVTNESVARPTFTATSTPTLSNIVPAGSGKVYVALAWRSEGRSLSSATIGGNAATIEAAVSNTNGTDSNCAIISYNLGTTGSATSVQLTLSNTIAAVSYRVWRVEGGLAGGPAETTTTGSFAANAASATVSTSMSTDGAILCVMMNIVQGTAVTWTNATEVDDLNHTDYRFTTAVRTGASFSGTITADGATDQNAMVTVSLR